MLKKNSSFNTKAKDRDIKRNKMTYYYWNWNGPIREPAALKFAEVCSQFNAKVKMDNVPDKLMHTPYYI